MPTIQASKKDLEKLVGQKFSRARLEEALMYVKGELDSMKGDELNIDVKETNRPELWSAEGIAREIRARMGIDRGMRKYKVNRAKISCTIEKSVEKTRPFICCAVIRNVKMTGEFLAQMIQLQEKVGTTFGRRRKETGIGLYDFGKMRPPVFYRGYRDNEIGFVPLEYNVPMRPSEILLEHPKGREFGHLLKGVDRYPIVVDSKNVVASMPPIINSKTTGKVTEKTRDVFLEVTGFNWETVNTALKVMCMAFADRGASIEAVKMNFPKTKTYPKRPVETPRFGTKKITIEADYVRKISGLDLKEKEIIALLERSGMNAKPRRKKIEAEYPDYRLDILHPVDVVEDIIIAHGYNNVEPEKVEMSVVGEELGETLFLDKARDVCVGMGLQEVLTFNLTSIGKQSLKMLLEKEDLAEISNPVSSNWVAMRKRITPELLDFLSKNRHAEYPQRIFEIGTCLSLDPSSETGVRQTYNLCIAMCDPKADFTTAKSVLEAVCGNLGLRYSLRETQLPFLEDGRSGDISVGKLKGFLGEVKPKVLENLGLDKKTVILELELVG